MIGLLILLIGLAITLALSLNDKHELAHKAFGYSVLIAIIVMIIEFTILIICVTH